jgi:hypothetical protein
VGWGAVGKIESNNKLEKYAHGEYLIHGRLENMGGLWQTVDLDHLIESGLWQAFPSWWENRFEKQLYQHMVALRCGY